MSFCDALKRHNENYLRNQRYFGEHAFKSKHSNRILSGKPEIPNIYYVVLTDPFFDWRWDFRIADKIFGGSKS